MKQKDPCGKISQKQYNSLGLVTKKSVFNSLNELKNQITYDYNAKVQMKKILRIIIFFFLIASATACAVIQKSPKAEVFQYKHTEISSVVFTKNIYIENSNTHNREKIENPEGWAGQLDYERLARNQGLIIRSDSDKYEVTLTLLDISNFNFTLNDYFRSYPYYFWATVSIMSLAIIPTYINRSITVIATIKNLATDQQLSFQENVDFDTWISIVYAFNGNYKAASKMSTEIVEPAVSSVFSKVKQAIDNNEI